MLRAGELEEREIEVALTEAPQIGFELPNGAGLAVSGVSVASAGLIQANTHVTGFAVADSASAVTAGLNALAGFGKLTSIGLTDGGTPVLSLSYTQYAADTAALAAISGSFALVISGAPASAAARRSASAISAAGSLRILPKGSTSRRSAGSTACQRGRCWA